MAYTMLLNTKKLDFAPDDSIGGLYVSVVQPSPIALEAGASYVLMWDGVKYTVDASDTEWGELVGVAVGNQQFIGGNDTGEPFIVAYIPSANILMCVTTSTDATHTIMFMVEDDTPTFAVEATTISDIANAIRGKTGDTTPMQVTDMAALIGGLVVSSGSNIRIARGSVGRLKDPYYPEYEVEPSPDGSYVITHNLGIRPDIIILFCGATEETGTKVACSLGFSSDLMSATNYTGYKGFTTMVGTVGNLTGINAAGFIGDDKGDCIRNANANTFTAFNDSFFSRAVNADYYYFVIGGLV